MDKLNSGDLDYLVNRVGRWDSKSGFLIGNTEIEGTTINILLYAVQERFKGEYKATIMDVSHKDFLKYSDKEKIMHSLGFFTTHEDTTNLGVVVHYAGVKALYESVAHRIESGEFRDSTILAIKEARKAEQNQQ